MRASPRDIHKDRYGDFRLTGAVRPSAELQIVPREGYRVQMFRDPARRLRVPMLAAAVSRERLFDTFLDLLAPLDPVVDAVLETSHALPSGQHRDLYREGIDLPVLMSHFCDHEELLLKDGCTGVAVLSDDGAVEVQFDEHKLLIVYARDLAPFEKTLAKWGVSRLDDLRFLTEAEHLHCTRPAYAKEFRRLCRRLGVRGAPQRLRG